MPNVSIPAESGVTSICTSGHLQPGNRPSPSWHIDFRPIRDARADKLTRRIPLGHPHVVFFRLAFPPAPTKARGTNGIGASPRGPIARPRPQAAASRLAVATHSFAAAGPTHAPARNQREARGSDKLRYVIRGMSHRSANNSDHDHGILGDRIALPGDASFGESAVDGKKIERIGLGQQQAHAEP